MRSGAVRVALIAVAAGLGLGLGLGLAACGGGSEVDVQVPASITVTSPAFAEGQPVPAVYSCRGRDVSPPLRWSGVPEQARELALVVDDPDAPRGTFTHWVLVGLAPETTDLPEDAALPAGARQARNSAGRAGYMGPCPPSGTHRYRFTVYALDAPLGVADGADTKRALAEIERHAIASGRLVGTFTA